MPALSPSISGVPAEQCDDLLPVARRFCRYARVHTTSDPSSASQPSTPWQLDLSRLLARELAALGLRNVELDDAGYLHATLPGQGAAAAFPLGLVAHVDTSPDAPGTGVRPLVHPRYDGRAFALPGDPAVVFDPAERPALRDAIGHDLITSDGTTLLGSDDKAGVAVIVQLAEDLVAADRAAAKRGQPPPPRPTLRLLFTPDEEIGRGVDALDLARFGARAAYTLDGSGVDRLNAETFNAAEAVVTIEGVGVHPGYAKGVLVNALRIAAELVARLPPDAAPETTDGRAGYVHPHTLTGTAEHAELRLLLRDFSDEGMAALERGLRAHADALARAHPRARIAVHVAQSYRNMLRYIEQTDPRTVALADEAARVLGFALTHEPVRGGTDGARLSERGIPTPNIFTGGHDFHSRFEWNTAQNLERALAFTHALVRAWGEHLSQPLSHEP